jgi:hypothetical protein
LIETEHDNAESLFAFYGREGSRVEETSPRDVLLNKSLPGHSLQLTSQMNCCLSALLLPVKSWKHVESYRVDTSTGCRTGFVEVNTYTVLSHVTHQSFNMGCGYFEEGSFCLYLEAICYTYCTDWDQDAADGQVDKNNLQDESQSLLLGEMRSAQVEMQ